jgi:hypothetical protein
VLKLSHHPVVSEVHASFPWHGIATGSIAILLMTGCYPEVSGKGPKQAATEEPQLASCPRGRVDDGEDGNNQVMAVAGRGGYWYTYSDKVGSTIDPPAGEAGGTFSMSEGGAKGSALAARMQGKVGRANIVFAGMGFSFVDPKRPYDASKFDGIAFLRKRATTSVRVKVPDITIDQDGKVCTECRNTPELTSL